MSWETKEKACFLPLVFQWSRTVPFVPLWEKRNNGDTSSKRIMLRSQQQLLRVPEGDSVGVFLVRLNFPNF